ncbi:uncharacterized protein LOC126162280 isoform X2 [Schistocerca cancellata]|uniref:uncharacterized protein LOC126162280 isoform X2 n=1 Tax=Schistocerca cancellata TaxID=274614 RepID=UPI0021181236|nr:uncharacterized protein LOC126162280 isoform X2 [Schistocerca cancellata]
MKISLLLVIALVAVAEVCGQPVESVSGPLEEIQRWKRDDTDKETICVSADNKFYLYANSVKLYTCYSQVPKVYVVKPKSLCKTNLSDCPKNKDYCKSVVPA